MPVVIKTSTSTINDTEPPEQTEESLIGNRDLKRKASKNNRSRKLSERESFSGICKEVYNPQYREFLSRDAKTWFQLSFFYFFFYACLSAFFILLLALFYQTIDLKKPIYFNKESVMHYKVVNPGLGFRPQVALLGNGNF